MLNFLALVYSKICVIFSIPERIIEQMNFLPEFLKDALIDSLNLVPFLFIMFIFIEWLEHYFTKKRHLLVFYMKKIGPLFGSLFSSIPQCGFSVIASTLYTRRILSRGTLLSVYFATSDEALPILISEPTMTTLILPLILIKIFVAVIVGYLVDILVTYKANTPQELSNCTNLHKQNCTCNNLKCDIKTKEFWLHPLKHTFNIFLFILLVSTCLGYVISIVGTEENLAQYCLMDSPLQPIIAALIGLIPNCAISVILTLLYIKHTISLGSLIAGLTSAGGLGLLILLTKNNDKKDTAIILGITIIVSSAIGLIIQNNLFNINSLFNILGFSI